MMENQSSLKLYFKELIKTEPAFKGLTKIKKTSDYVCDLFIYEPVNAEEAQIGSLFMLGEIKNIPKNRYRNFDLLLNLLISVVKREFYSDHKRNAAEALEASLNKANLYLADFTEKGNVEWMGNLHFVCGAFSQNILHITRVGEPIIKLFRGTTISHIENKFPLPKKIHPLKTFGNIVSGTMIEGDKVILATKNILNIISTGSLKEFSKGSCCQIANSLKKITENKLPLLCLILETKKEAPEEIATCIPTVEQDQISSNEYLTVRKNKIKSVALKIFFVSKKISIFILIGIYKIIYKPLALLCRKISRTHLLHPFLGKIEAKIQNFVLKITERIVEFKNNKILVLHQQNKPAFFVASLLVLLVLILPFTIRQKINYHVRMNDFNQLSAQIQEIQRRTDIALIYSDKEKARGLIQQDQLLLASLSECLKKPPLKNNNNFISAVSELQEKYQEQQDSIDNVKRVKNLEEILNFSQSGFIVSPLGMSKVKNNLYFYELESGILYSLNLSDEKKNLTLIFISAKDEFRKMTVLENDLIGLFGQSGKMYLYDSSTNAHKTYSLDPNVAIENIRDVRSFLSGFYVLDKEQSKIIKYAFLEKEENIIHGKDWLLKLPEESGNAQSMAIDGSIYILDANGTITEYFKGEKAGQIDLNNEAGLRPVSQELKNPLAGDNKIFIKKDFKNFYISDPKNKRIIILDKNGAVINQYLSEKFATLQDFLVTNDEKEIYLLCGKKVYKLTI